VDVLALPAWRVADASCSFWLRRCRFPKASFRFRGRVSWHRDIGVKGKCVGAQNHRRCAYRWLQPSRKRLAALPWSTLRSRAERCDGSFHGVLWIWISPKDQGLSSCMLSFMIFWAWTAYPFGSFYSFTFRLIILIISRRFGFSSSSPLISSSKGRALTFELAINRT
jgi:hypothetical protein